MRYKMTVTLTSPYKLTDHQEELRELLEDFGEGMIEKVEIARASRGRPGEARGDILDVLYNAGQWMKASEVARLTGRSTVTVYRVLKELAREGELEYRFEEIDGIGYWQPLAPKGE